MRSLLISSLVLLLAASGLYAGQCGGSVPCSCGDTVTSDYVMTADIGTCSTHGLYVADGVTLDGAGHRITGPGNSTETYGIYLTGTNGATVKNVVVTGFLRGIRVRDSHNNLILNNETFQNGDFGSHVGYGIDVAKGSSNNTFQGNSIHNNADEGIHFGTGSFQNVFTGNTVYDNYLENVYVLASDNHTFTDNTIWGGRNSFYVKDSSFGLFEGNDVSDATFVIRGDSHNNLLQDNDLVDTGVHFQVYTKATPYRYPHDNTMIRGTVTGASKCVRFSSSWANTIIDTVLSQCSTDIASTGDQAQSYNTFISPTYNSSKVSLDSNSSIDFGWHLDVHVQNGSGNPLAGANVKATNAGGTVLFNTQTDSSGDITSQEVVEYTQTSSGKTFHTPITLDTTKSGYQPDNRQVALSSDTTIAVTLDPGENTAPIANAGPDQNVTSGDAVTLDGSASSDPDGDVLIYNWNFGDGNSSIGDQAVVNHTYSSAGTYTATLTVSDGSLSDTDTAVITVTNPAPPPNNPPTANAGPDQTVTVGQSVTLDGSGSSDPDGDALSYSWDFGDGNTGEEAVITHVYSSPGTYTATLTASDHKGGVAEDSVVMTVMSAPAAEEEVVVDNTDLGFIPIPSANWWLSSNRYAEGYYGTNYLYAASTTYKPGTDIRAKWTPTLAGGMYEVFARFGSGWSTWATDSPFTVNHADGSTTVRIDQRIAYNGAWISLGIYRFDAGTTGNVVLSNDAGWAYVVADAIKWVQVGESTAPPQANSSPTANAGPDKTAIVGEAVTVDGSGSSDPDGDSLSYNWDLGDGSTASGSAVTHSYAVAGTYTVTLTVTDGELTDTDTAIIAVSLAPAAEEEVVVDNTDLGFIPIPSANWWLSSNRYAEGYYGTNYLYAASTTYKPGTDIRAKWTPTLAGGMYEVFARFGSGWSTWATDSPFTVNHADGSTTVRIDQRIAYNGAWISLGIYRFDAGTTGNVVLSNDAGWAYVVADAIKWVSR